jgi:C4-dicarboxylate-specific signal transduction histidine kinase
MGFEGVSAARRSGQAGRQPLSDVHDSASLPENDSFLPGICAPSDPSARARLTAMSAMAAAMAHELSQPLTAASNYMQGCAAVLRQRIHGLEQLLGFIEDAAAQTARASDIVLRMRAFVKTGRIEARPECLDEMLDAVTARLSCLGNVEVVRAFQPGSTCVLGDRIQIEMVLSNLLLNAAQAMWESDVRRIEISSWVEGDRIRIRVADTGPGVAPEIREHLFEPMVSTKVDGTGLGLAISQTIVDAHDGMLTLEPSEPGEGAVFVLALPRGQEFF